MKCERCGGGPLFETVVFSKQGNIRGMSCLKCGEYQDGVVKTNRTPEMIGHWKRQTDQEFSRPMNKAEKVENENEPEAIYLGL